MSKTIMSKKEYIDALNFLIKSEQDAIGEYSMIIDTLPSGGGWKQVLQELTKILKDEEEHIETLMYLMKSA